ncbi:STE-domain-containing protein [Trametes sanguinea]|nr:STE-domain-containing protein [Trametes sanguinea]
MQERDLLAHLDRLKFFLATAPSRWNASSPPSLPSSLPSEFPLPVPVPAGHPHSAHPALNRFLLPNQEYVSCVLWGGLYHITGTDIVRALVFRFEAFGRPVRNMKKFEEGVFSDLRNLKPGVDACLEEPKSPFLDLLFKYQCIRTQKKQKVFYWFSVPHDRLFLDALERDLKREKMGLEPTTVVVGEPALSFTYDPKRSLYEQFSKAHGAREGEGELEAAVRRADEAGGEQDDGGQQQDEQQDREKSVAASASEGEHSASDADDAMGDEKAGGSSSGSKAKKGGKKPTALGGPHSPAHEMFGRGARGEFGANPDLVVTQKERQRRAMDEFAAAAVQGKLSFLSGPGVAPSSSSSSASGASAQDMMFAQSAMEFVAPGHQQQQQFGAGQHHQQHNHSQRPPLEQRHTYPLVDFTAPPSRTMTDPYAIPPAVGQGLTTGWAPSASTPYLSAAQHSPESQWATVPQAHPHSSQHQPASAVGLHIAARLDASYHTAGALGDYVTSISAPSHKLTFDHAALYPPELALSAGGSPSSGPGPIRRHRSATPSIPRYGESIRRPFSAALSDSSNANANGSSQGAPGTSAASSSAGNRSYHPYAVPGHHQPSSSSRSAQSSPMAYSVPLGYDAARHAHPHGHSRSSSSGGLQEQMRQMLSLDQMDAESMAQQYAAAMYRTDSPMQYGADAYGMSSAHSQQQQQQPSEFFSHLNQHPHHSL